MNSADLSQAAIFFIVLLFSLALHEFAHAWVADKRGDPLPRSQGRVTFDPFSHLDPIGSLLIPGVMIFLPALTGSGMPFALIGWGRPVQISLPNPKTRRADETLITLAGPAMNILIALVASVLGGMAYGFFPEATLRFFKPTIVVNLCLAIFNLLPVPPLDGSHILKLLVGMSETAYARLASYGWIILFVLINLSFFRQALGMTIVIAEQPFILIMAGVASLTG